MSVETESPDQRLLTEDELNTWETQGYLHVRNALKPEDVDILLGQLISAQREFQAHMFEREYWRDIFDAGNDRDLSICNGIRWCADVRGLVDHANVFGKVLGIMGPYIQLLGSELFFRHPNERPLVDFHTDVGPALSRVRAVGHGAVQLKVQYFLTDVSVPDSGNFTIAPGSHHREFPGKISFSQVDSPLQIMAGAGDAVLFPLNLGHAVAPNTSGRMRVSVILRYGQMFCRPVDYWNRESDSVLARATPRQRRLLGDMGEDSRPGDFYGLGFDHLETMYGEEWTSSSEAKEQFAAFEANQEAYESVRGL
jgi:hypothetical protein